MIHSQRTAEIDIMISISHCRRLQFMSNVINKCECEISVFTKIQENLDIIAVTANGHISKSQTVESLIISPR